MSRSGSEKEAEEDFEEGDGDDDGDGGDQGDRKGGNDGEGEVGDDEGDDEEKAENNDSEVLLQLATATATESQRGSKVEEDDVSDAGAEEAAVQESEPGPDEIDDEDAMRVVGRRRKAMAEVHDPSRVRRRKLREYYAGGERDSYSFSCLSICQIKFTYHASCHSATRCDLRCSHRHDADESRVGSSWN